MCMQSRNKWTGGEDVALTIQQLRAERRKTTRDLLSLMKKLDGTQESLQRALRQALGRKKGYIDIKDLSKWQVTFKMLMTDTNNFGNLLAKGFIE